MSKTPKLGGRGRTKWPASKQSQWVMHSPGDDEHPEESARMVLSLLGRPTHGLHDVAHHVNHELLEQLGSLLQKKLLFILHFFFETLLHDIDKETRFRSFSVKSEIQLFVMTALRPLFHLPGHNFSNNSQ